MDKEYQELQDYGFQLDAIVRLLETKFNDFRNSYFTVQKVYEERALGAPTVDVQGTSNPFPTSMPTPPQLSLGQPYVPSVSVDGGPFQVHTAAPSGPPVTQHNGLLIGKARY